MSTPEPAGLCAKCAAKMVFYDLFGVLRAKCVFCGGRRFR